MRRGRAAAAVLLAATAAVAAAVSTACRGRSRSDIARFAEAADRAEEPLEAAWRRCDEAIGRGDLPGARQAAVRARDAIEAMRVGRPLETALREELTFLNHAIPGFRRFAAADGGAAAQEQLRDILRRGRAHQRRGRESLRGDRSS